MSLQRTGYTKKTPNHYWVDAGAVYKNLKYNNETKEWEGTLLGATAEGNKLTIENEYRQIEVDGVFTKAVGQEVLKSANAKLEINIKEITAENIRLAINGEVRDVEEGEAPEGYKVIEGKSKLEDSDYFENLALVGTITGSKQPIIAVLDNALCTSGLDAETKDDDETVLKMTFEAHAGADQVANRKLPARIYFPPINKEVKEESKGDKTQE
ncbi:hypothetical protein [Clostridium tetani]|uniref:hypothetical protein n=1 Tax=Clostridium tetani TaxID=1513 RepID=UPI001025B616|nr:hypothetical protein [Clostridium tetani]RXI72134.1 hypothetical protein DP127_07685 [Clostridium tetani]BDR75273.1 hypothetical protein K154306013_09330 [Clostridium tetani]